MKRRLIDITEFRAGVQAGNLKPKTAVRVAQLGEPVPVGDNSRVVRFVFSDNSVDRYGDTIDARGWVLDGFNVNPICLFGHDADTVENVIGRAVKVWVEGNRLVGDIEFMAAEVNATAETVFQMVKGGYLNTVSVGFNPIEWVLTKDKSRPGGIDFKKQELLEISIVPIPANPNAIVQAKAAGIDVDRLNLADDRVDTATQIEAIRSYLVGDLSLNEMRKRCGHKPIEDQAAPQKRSWLKRGLYDVGYLASILADLGYLEDWVEWEAAAEGDGSQVSQMLLDAMKVLGQALIAMTIEEVGELLADEAGESPSIDVIIADDVVELDAGKIRTRAFRLFRHLDDAALLAFSSAMKAHLQRKAVTFSVKDAAPVELRAGKVLSASNEKTLRDAHGMMTQACDMVMGVCEAATPAEDTTEEKTAPGPDDVGAARARRAKALHLAHSHEPTAA